MSKIYMFDQNNSGGSFVSDDKLCHRVWIEADTYDEAEAKAESMGVYFNGCDDGMDCPCCGDRWYSGDELKIDQWKKKGCPVNEYVGSSFSKKDPTNQEKIDAEVAWHAKWDKFTIVKEPKHEKKYSMHQYIGSISFKDEVEYAQYMANSYGGWTKPEVRIFYKDGSVKEVFTEK